MQRRSVMMIMISVKIIIIITDPRTITTRFEFNLWKIIPRYFPKNFFTLTVVV